MAKKTFLDSPAMQFISTAPEQEAAQTVSEAVEPIIEQTEAEQRKTPVKADGSVPRYTERREVKTRKTQLIFRPSTYEKARREAAARGLSINEYIHLAIESMEESPKE